MNTTQLEKTLDTLRELKRRKVYRKKDYFEPYPKQKEFFDNGTGHRERLLMAGNQLGKTYAGAFETACHLTGEYPAYWNGRKFDHPVRAWAAGETSTLVRDGPQKLLCGEAGVDVALGSGMIPKENFVDKPSMARGVTDAFDTIQIQHRTNGVVDGVSVLRFKSYEQGRAKFQSETLDFIWFDEEPDVSIYSEGLTRITATAGMVFMTFTPLKGMSDVVARFLNEPSEDRIVTSMTIDDAKHIPPEDKAKIIAGYPAHEREARVRGVPLFGEGLIFQVSQEAISEPRIVDLPSYWTKLWGIDFGIGHPFAAVLGAWDKDNDVVHILHCIRVRDQLPINHAAAMKVMGAAVPVAWPQDGTSREKSSGETLASLYKKEGLVMLSEHATWPDGGVSTEAGVMEMYDRMTTARFKVASHLSDWFEEMRMYHRKDGQIVKSRDDLMSATRILIMMKRFARAVHLGSKKPNRFRGGLADGVEFDIF